jgi:hypothetical protein
MNSREVIRVYRFVFCELYERNWKFCVWHKEGLEKYWANKTCGVESNVFTMVIRPFYPRFRENEFQFTCTKQTVRDNS